MIYIVYKEVGIRPHIFVLDNLVVAVGTIIPIVGKNGDKSQKISPGSLGRSSGEFTVVEANGVKISSCQKLYRHQRDEKKNPDH